MHYTCAWSLIGSGPMFVSYAMNEILWYQVRHELPDIAVQFIKYKARGTNNTISFIMTMTNTINVRYVIYRESNLHIKGGGIFVDKARHKSYYIYSCSIWRTTCVLLEIPFILFKAPHLAILHLFFILKLILWKTASS
jgi:hypothetical protein